MFFAPLMLIPDDPALSIKSRLIVAIKKIVYQILLFVEMLHVI
jgi:hypothetical protein